MGDPKDRVLVGTIEGGNRFFTEQRWSDGLPIVPPTVERVEEFLKYTDQPWDAVVGVLPIAYRRTLGWHVAVNGVMAGGPPEFMPVLIAYAKALADGDYRRTLASPLGKAARYWVNEYTTRVGYLRDGRFEIDSNLVENDGRASAVGKRRWHFIGHPEAGWRSAVICTLIPSCRRYGINPQEYLTEVLGRLPAMTHSQVRERLPGRWCQARRGGGAGGPIAGTSGRPRLPGNLYL